MTKELVLITGVSGHVGFRVLVEALSRNYSVRAVIRRSEQEAQIRRTESIKSREADLQFVVVEDLLKEGAFDGVLDGVDGVLHVASPLPMATEDYRRDVIDPAILATTNVLTAAAKVPSVRRVVITSSIATLLTMDPFTSPIAAYAASKTHALAASEAFVAREQPHFDIVSILPSMVIGRNELSTAARDLETGTNGIVIGPLIGAKSEMPTLGASVHLHDVARAHVDALNPAMSGNRRLLCSSGGLEGTVWDAAKEVVRRRYAKEVADGVFSLAGTAPSRPMRFDVSETEKLLGWEFIGFEEQVVSVVDQYVELVTSRAS
ncbi:hypothetical protein C7974DRAFT_462263 [Boeremia exigua]|uniref:uncharacterized protein n=1 Tax=Boeremia exigua TaxID=749465 RepID=UPI001E8DAF41|nr:uncharacterized protein C7974DRAFT_462263 [Boeremia exigua]KAH6637868.1 hypothetical protein C7974DRAFT_462263 [Boeremia exigua]